MRIAVPDHLITPEIMEAALEATMLADEQAILRGEIPDVREAIAGGIKWKPEPFLDGEHFDLGHEVMRRRWGDCDDLAPWLAASLRATGEDAGAIPRVYKSGKDRWHVVTQTGDGEIQDPSKWAGMGKKSAPTPRGVVGVIARPFAHDDRGALCVMPRGDHWCARADVPFRDADAHIASHGFAKSPERALDRAISGAMACGEHVYSPILDRLREAGTMLFSDVADIADGYTFDGSDVIGESEVGWDGKDLYAAKRYLAAIKNKVKPDKQALYDRTVSSDEEIHKWWESAGKQTRNNIRLGWGKRPNILKTLGKVAKTAVSVAVPGSGTLLNALSHGHGSKKAPGAVHNRRGGVSVPVKHHASKDDHPMTLYYHPAGAIGPVVMRF